MKKVTRNDLYIASLILEGKVKDALNEIREAHFQTGNYQYIPPALDAIIELAEAMKKAAKG